MKVLIFLAAFYISFSALCPQTKLNPELQLLIERARSNKFQSSISSAAEEFGVIIYTQNHDLLKSSGIKVNSVMPDFVTANLTLIQIQELSLNDDIKFISTGETNFTDNDVVSGVIGANQLHSGLINNTTYTGKGVAVCIIDTGIDWKHPDFRDPLDQTKSRITAIWDQTLAPSSGEHSPSLFNYGVEYSKADIENELDGSPAGFIREADINGHGTHVAGTAAGNGFSGKYTGIAPETDILVVKAGNGSFQTSNIIDALTWAENKAASLEKAVVVNMSFGSDAGSHDGTDAKSSAINNFTGNGKVVVVSAGNSGGSNIHLSGIIPASDSAIISVMIPEYIPKSGSGNDNIYLDTWIDNDPDVDVKVKSPNGFQSVQIPGKQSTTHTGDGAIYTYNYVIDQNHDRELYVGIYDSDASKPPIHGIWQVIFINTTDSSVEFHSWLNDGCIGNTTAYLIDGDNNYTLGNTASEAIVTGSYADRWTWESAGGNIFSCGSSDRTGNISTFSGKGPTRNNILKPDITAPGQAIISCRSVNAIFSENKIVSDYYVMNQGTSMSSAVVTGAAALLLEQNKDLTAEQIKNLLTSSSIKDNYTGDILPDNAWGYGKLNIEEAMVRELGISSAVSEDKSDIDDFQLNQNYPNPFNPVTMIVYHLGSDCNVELRIYDVLGKEVMVLDSGFRKAGSYSIELNAGNLSSGVYFYQLRAGQFTAVKKLVLKK